MDPFSHAFTRKHCPLTREGFLSVECNNSFFCKVYVAAESVGFAQQIESGGMAGRGTSANCGVETMQRLPKTANRSRGGAKHSLMGLNIETWCFRENSSLKVFDFKNVIIFLLILNFLTRIKIFYGN